MQKNRTFNQKLIQVSQLAGERGGANLLIGIIFAEKLYENEKKLGRGGARDLHMNCFHEFRTKLQMVKTWLQISTSYFYAAFISNEDVSLRVPLITTDPDVNQ